MDHRILIVGFGNTLVGDDGAGPAVIALLQAEALPEGVRAEDGGADALRLPAIWSGERDVWLVDAIAAGAPPGTIHRFSHEQVLELPQRHATAHQLSLPESLRWVVHAYPEMASVSFRMWGIEVKRVALDPGLSGPVETAVRAAARELRARAATLARSDHSPRPTRSSSDVGHG